MSMCKSHLQNTFIGMIDTKMLLNSLPERNAQASFLGAELPLDFLFVRKQTVRIALECGDQFSYTDNVLREQCTS